MYTVRISDDLKAILDRLVAQGFAGTPAEAIAQAVLRSAAESESWDDALADAVDAGLADMRNGNYVTIDGPHSRETFWNEVTSEASEAVTEMRSRAARPAR